eukprot:TRINITY_DN12166_c0_g1_i1.p1 TRINITY_DN12166_c0_g1~~TRINITY_DN12166_c0_g1_i1.p1  ORF type:complete len:105 (+),score=14.37 TRINITY_DN12166_c0_g1_i1:216-530(+)
MTKSSPLGFSVSVDVTSVDRISSFGSTFSSISSSTFSCTLPLTISFFSGFTSVSPSLSDLSLSISLGIAFSTDAFKSRFGGSRIEFSESRDRVSEFLAQIVFDV